MDAESIDGTFEDAPSTLQFATTLKWRYHTGPNRLYALRICMVVDCDSLANTNKGIRVKNNRVCKFHFNVANGIISRTKTNGNTTFPSTLSVTSVPDDELHTVAFNARRERYINKSGEITKWPKCRCINCKNVGNSMRRKDGFCDNHFTRYSIKLQKQAVEMQRLHLWKVEAGLCFKDITLTDYVLFQAGLPDDDVDANAHLDMNYWVFHATNIDRIDKWYKFPMLMPADQLPAETVGHLQHELHLTNGGVLDPYCWGSTDPWRSLCFLINNRGRTIGPGTVQYMLVFAPNMRKRNGGYNLWSDFPLDNHDCVVQAKGSVEPSLILRLDFKDQSLLNANIKVVWMFGKFVDIKGRDYGWRITSNGVTHKDYPHLGVIEE